MNEEFNKFVADITTDGPKGLEEMMGFKQTELPAKAEEAPEKEETNEPRKNRHHRRLEQQLQREHDARIEAEARARALLEFQTGKSTDDIDPELTQLYGNEERGKEAALVHQRVLDKTFERAKQEALAEFENRQSAKDAEVKQFESYIDSEFESLEDDHDVDLTSNAPAARKARNEILELLESASPKDEAGNIKEYADMNFVFETWKTKHSQEKSGASDRQREVASRGMVKGENTPIPEKKPTPGMRGWMTDYGLK